MRLNWNTQILGQKVILVPYCPHHVPKYHGWMKSQELQHLTGSEPLTFEEECQMQETWKNSDDKCTFIILHKDTFTQSKDEIKAMIGDTNVFLQEGGDLAEAEIMIAETDFRGQKLGWESMVLMLLYCMDHLPAIRTFQAKIKLDNEKSIGMFQKMHFKEESKSQVFQEVTMTAQVTDEWRQTLKNSIGPYESAEYKHDDDQS